MRKHACNIISTAIAFAAIAGSTSAHADLLPGYVSSVSPEVSISTLGIGPEVDFRFAKEPFGLRLGANFFSISHNVKSGDASYHGTVDLNNGGAIADWYPFGHGLRLSGGFKINGNHVNVVATPNGAGTITVNHNSYAYGAGDSVTGKMSFDTFSPYVGLGFGGEIFGGPTLAVDLGAMFEGSPKTTLTASGPITADPGFTSDLAAEQQSLHNKVKDFSVYPVLQIALGWRF